MRIALQIPAKISINCRGIYTRRKPYKVCFGEVYRSIQLVIQIRKPEPGEFDRGIWLVNSKQCRKCYRMKVHRIGFGDDIMEAPNQGKW